MNAKQRITVLVMDVLLLVELTVCIYLGQNSAWDLTGFFIKTYLPAAAATVVIALLLIRRWGDGMPVPDGDAGRERQ